MSLWRFPKLWLGAHLSLTRFAIDIIKESNFSAVTGRRLRYWNRSWLAVELLFASLLLTVESVNRRMVAESPLADLLLIIAFWRINEVAYAFARDAIDKLHGAPIRSDISAPERMGMLAGSYLGSIVQFATVYFYLFRGCGFNQKLGSFSEALYFSAMSALSGAPEGMEITSPWLQFVHVYQAALSVLLLVIALSVYIGAAKR